MLISAVAAVALASAAADPAGPCALATAVEAELVLGATAIDVPADQLGEATAPTCLWASEGRRSEAKITIWSADELPVLGLSDAADYFSKLRQEFASDAIRYIEGLGERAFEAEFAPSAALRASGTIVVLKADRVAVFEFVNVVPDGAHNFVASVIERL